MHFAVVEGPGGDQGSELKVQRDWEPGSMFLCEAGIS